MNNKLSYYNYEVLKNNLLNRVNKYLLAYNRLYNYYKDPNLRVKYIDIKLHFMIDKMLSNVKRDLNYCNYVELKTLLYSIYE